MRIGCSLAFAGLVVGVGGCTHVSREAAVELSHAGAQAAMTLGSDVDIRVSRLRAQRAAQDFVAAYDVMSKCSSITHGTSTDPNCDTASFAVGRAANPVNQQIGLLADAVMKRSKALKALGAAYVALGDEAGYDAPGDLDNAIAPALDAVNQFGSAVGLGPLPALVDQGIALVGHVLAANAQKQRLVRGSHRIAQITRHMRLALTKERDLFGALDDMLASLDRETRRSMLTAGLIDPSATVKSIAAGAGLSIADARLASSLGSDPALRGAAEAATLDTLPPVSSDDLDLGIALLSDLEAQHARFEHGEAISAARIAADAEKISDLIATSKK